MTTRKLHTGFRFLSTSTTLDDLERTASKCIVFSEHATKQNEDRRTESVRKVYANHSSFWQYKVCEIANIGARFHKSGLSKTVIVSFLLVISSEISDIKVHVPYYTAIRSPWSAFQRSQNLLPWMTSGQNSSCFASFPCYRRQIPPPHRVDTFSVFSLLSTIHLPLGVGRLYILMTRCRAIAGRTARCRCKCR